MDGTLYLGNQLFEGVPHLFNTMNKKDLSYLFLTNNSSKNKTLYRDKWLKLGFDFSSDRFITSGESCTYYLKKINKHRKVYVIGTDSLKQEITEAGFLLEDKNPDVVVMGYDTDITYEKLVKANQFIRDGVDYVATHPDVTCPSETGSVPDCGSFIELLFQTTGKRPKITGKPYAEITEVALNKLNAKPSEVAIVGDRLHTDMQMGFSAGMTTVLVLSGETSTSDLNNAEKIPDFILDNITGIPPLL